VEVAPNSTSKPKVLVEGERGPQSTTIYVDSRGNASIGSSVEAVPNRVSASNSLSSDSNIPEYTYRGASEGPEVVFERGFRGRGNSSDVYLHAKDNTDPPSIYVSSSKSEDVGIDFTTALNKQKGNLYTVRPGSDAIDVNAVLGRKSPYPYEQEIAVTYKVPAEDVRGVTPVNADGTYKGISVLNPNFKP